MSEFRQNPATREWILFAPERARRPGKQPRRAPAPPRPPHDPECPLCPGQEEACTPGETLRYLDAAGNWTVRSFPNKFPAVEPHELADRTGAMLERRMPAVGHHEVICESRRHDATLANLARAEVELVVRAWHERIQALRLFKLTDYVSLFKNHGVRAGTSLEHPHSQIVTLPMVPWQVRHRLEGAARYYDDHGRCVWCDVLHEERDGGLRLVGERPGFTAFVPYATYRPSTIWIVPHVHAGCFSLAQTEALPELASLLHEVLFRLERALGDPSFNLVFRVGSRGHLRTEYCHWYLAIVPRLSKMSGFELGTGMYINTSWPEQDARKLRKVAYPG